MALKMYNKTLWNNFEVFKKLINNKSEKIGILKKSYYILYECLSIYIRQ